MKPKIKTKIESEDMVSSNFSKYDFVKSYTKNAKTEREKLIKEEEACLIADALKNNSQDYIKNLATKDELLATKDELKLEIIKLDNKIDIVSRDIVIKITVIMGTLLTLFHALDRFTS